MVYNTDDVLAMVLARLSATNASGTPLRLRTFTIADAALLWRTTCDVAFNQLQVLHSNKQLASGRVAFPSVFGFVTVRGKKGGPWLHVSQDFQQSFAVEYRNPLCKITGTSRVAELQVREIARRAQRAVDEVSRFLKLFFAVLGDVAKKKEQRVHVLFHRFGTITINNGLLEFTHHLPHSSSSGGQQHDDLFPAASHVDLEEEHHQAAMGFGHRQTQQSFNDDDSEEQPNEAVDDDYLPEDAAATRGGQLPPRPPPQPQQGGKRPPNITPPLDLAALQQLGGARPHSAALSSSCSSMALGAGGGISYHHHHSSSSEGTASAAQVYVPQGSMPDKKDRFFEAKKRRFVVDAELASLQNQLEKKLGMGGSRPGSAAVSTSHQQHGSAMMSGRSNHSNVSRCASALSGTLRTGAARSHFRQPSPLAVENVMELAASRQQQQLMAARQADAKIDDDMERERLLMHVVERKEHDRRRTAAAESLSYMQTQLTAPQQPTKLSGGGRAASVGPQGRLTRGSATPTSIARTYDLKPFETASVFIREEDKHEKRKNDLGKAAGYRKALDAQRAHVGHIKSSAKQVEVNQDRLRIALDQRETARVTEERRVQRSATFADNAAAWRYQIGLKSGDGAVRL